MFLLIVWPWKGPFPPLWQDVIFCEKPILIVVIYYAKIANIPWFQLLKCEDLCLFSALCHLKWNMFGFWTVCRTKKTIWRRHFAAKLWLAFFTIFSHLLYNTSADNKIIGLCSHVCSGLTMPKNLHLFNSFPSIIESLRKCTFLKQVKKLLVSEEYINH